MFVGEGTEIGKIAARLASGGTNKKTELTVTMERLMYFLVFIGLVFGETPTRESRRSFLFDLVMQSSLNHYRKVASANHPNSGTYPWHVTGVFIFWAFKWNIDNQALLYASATLVAILPEAAIVLITVTMAISVRRMAESNAIVRQMTALEQLGKVTDICSDKTGTLTEGKAH